MQKRKIRRIIVMCFGILIMGLGIALFKLSLMGNDPSSAMVMAIGDKIGVPFSTLLIIANTLFFASEFLFGRKLIGIGTFVNWFCVGILTTFYADLISKHFTVPEGFFQRFMMMVLGVLVLSLAASLYQTADLGIAPYDSLSIMMDARLPIPYFWCRIITDSICTVIALAFGGIIGLGTLACALGLGPFITFFNRFVSEKLCGTK